MPKATEAKAAEDTEETDDTEAEDADAEDAEGVDESRYRMITICMLQDAPRGT